MFSVPKGNQLKAISLFNPINYAMDFNNTLCLDKH